MSVAGVVAVMRPIRSRWWFTGGHALELYAHRSWRPHDDIDIGIRRSDVQGLEPLLDDWEIFVAAGGELSPWGGEPVSAASHENNLWLRSADGPWRLDICLGAGDDDQWVYRRDPALSLPWAHAIRSTTDGIPYLAPELQLLFKSKNVRPKDQVDAETIVPILDTSARDLLAKWLPMNHVWRTLLR